MVKKKFPQLAKRRLEVKSLIFLFVVQFLKWLIIFIITCNQEQEPFNELDTNLKKLVLLSMFSISKNLNCFTYYYTPRKDMKSRGFFIS